MLNIVSAPNPVLSQSAKKVSKIDAKILKFIDEMKQSLLSARDPIGVGLAAPQTGRSLQIFIAKPNEKSPILVFINPVIEKFLDTPTQENRESKQSEKTARAKEKAGIDKNIQLEGCLSLKDIWGEVKRHPGVLLSYQDEKGKKNERLFTGFTATIIQHEYDHLQGTLFPKRVLEQKGKLYKSIKNKKGEDEFEEMEI